MRCKLLAALAFSCVALVTTCPASFAANYPCSKSKGGVERCSGSKFVCRDGSVSSSKKECTPERADAFRQEWDADNGVDSQEPAEPEQPSDSQGDTQGFNAPQAPLLLASSVSTDTTRVIDGDTIKVGGITYRLEGIDAPEMKQTCEDAAGSSYPCGRRAKEALAKMISGPVQCETTGQDRYGRSLGYCTSGGTDLNEQMILQGWALAFVKYSDRYVAQERQARISKAGLWAGKAEAPWDWRADQIAALAPKGDCVIKGNISKGLKVYYLPFHLMYARVKVDEAKGERWFCTEQDAIAAGWERAQR